MNLPPASKEQDFKNFLEKKFGKGSVERGQKLFARNCATCHSSQKSNNNFEDIDFLATTELESGEQVRADWLGNDKSTPVLEVGTYKCRALHTNHKKESVWEQFSSETHKNLPSVLTDNFGRKISGGPGYYRNISLLNVWAYAPFMHNNAIGPEICAPADNAREVVRTKNVCENRFDSSVGGRLKIYEKSMDELLTPSKLRPAKVTRIDSPIQFPLGIKDLNITFPAGTPLNTIANFDLKAFIYDFTASYALFETQGDVGFNKYWQTKFASSPHNAAELGTAVKELIASFKVNGLLPNLKTISKYYRTCETGNDAENLGHDFGTALNDNDKRSLKAFMATL